MAASFPVEAVLKGRDALTRVVNRVGKAFGKLSRKALLTRKDIKKLGKGIARARDRFLLVSAAAVGAAAIGFKRFIETTAEANDNLAKFSRRAGLTAQTYAELRFAAGIAGVATQDFDKAIEKFNRNIGEAKGGIGGLTTLLKKVNPQFLKSVKATKNNEEALALMIRAMNRFEDPAKRAAFAAAVFGRAGQKMTLLTEGGIEALDKQRLEFRKWFGIIDTKGLKASEDFVDAQLQMNTAIGGLKFKIANQLIPVLTPLLKKFSDWIALNRDDAVKKITGAVKDFGAALALINWPKVLGRIGKFLGVIGDVFDAFDRLTGGNGVIVLFAAALASKFIPLIAFVGKALFTIGTALLANPILALIAGIALAATFIITNWEKVEAFFVQLWENLKQIFADIKAAIEEAFVGTAKLFFTAEELERAGVGGDVKKVEERQETERVRQLLFPEAGAAAPAAAAGAVTAPQVPTQAPILAGLAAALGIPSEVRGQIVVSFKDVPSGVRVSTPKQTGGAKVSLETKVGRASIRAGAPS